MTVQTPQTTVVSQAHQKLIALCEAFEDKAEAISCAVLIHFGKGGWNKNNLRLVKMKADLSEDFIASAKGTIGVVAKDVATHDAGLVYFTYDAIPSGHVGVLELSAADKLAKVVGEFPGNGWDKEFKGEDEVSKGVSYYVTSIKFANRDKRLLMFRRQGASGFMCRGSLYASLDTDVFTRAPKTLFGFADGCDFFFWDGMSYIRNLDALENSLGFTELTEAVARKNFVEVNKLLPLKGSEGKLAGMLKSKRTRRKLAALEREGVLVNLDPKRFQADCQREEITDVHFETDPATGKTMIDFDEKNARAGLAFLKAVAEDFWTGARTGTHWEAHSKTRRRTRKR